jgi:hypothetical protein
MMMDGTQGTSDSRRRWHMPRCTDCTKMHSKSGRGHRGTKTFSRCMLSSFSRGGSFCRLHKVRSIRRFKAKATNS